MFFSQYSLCSRFYLDDEKLLTIPEGKLIDDDDRAPDDCFTGFYDFGEPWNGDHNPWTQDLTCDQFMAPFDQDVRIAFLVILSASFQRYKFCGYTKPFIYNCNPTKCSATTILLFICLGKLVKEKGGLLLLLLFQFHFIINVAVGGTNYYIPDDCVNAGGAEG